MAQPESNAPPPTPGPDTSSPQPGPDTSPRPGPDAPPPHWAYFRPPPEPPDEPAPPRSGWTAARLLAIVLLIAGAGGGGALIVWPAIHAKPTRVAPLPVSLTTPDTLDGLPLRSADNPLQKALASVAPPGVTITGDNVFAYYNKVGSLDTLLLTAGTSSRTAPEKRLAEFTSSMAGRFKGPPRTVDPGPMGGLARCADLTATHPQSICFWADDYTTATVFALVRPATALAPLLPAIRSQVEHSR